MRPSLQDILGDVRVTCGGGPEGRAPMEVPDLRAALPNFWDPTPPAESPATVGFASRRPRDPVSARVTLQSACQSPPRREPGSTRSPIPHNSMALAMRCHGAFKACEGCGEARCHPVRGNDRERASHLNPKPRSAFPTVTPEVTLHAAVTWA